MKNLIFTTIVWFVVASVSAQTPLSFRYQAVARDNSGNVLANKNVSFQISILNGSVSGTVEYSEIHTGLTTNAFGLVELEIGRGTPVTGTFSVINWGINSYFVKIEMDPEGGTAYQTLSTSQLLSVPYSLHAKTVEHGDNWGNQSVETDATLTGNGTPTVPLKIANNGVSSAKIQDGTIENADLADNAVSTLKIADGSITTADLANSTVTTDKLGNLAVNSAKIQSGAVTSDKLAANAVTDAKIATGAVTGAKIAQSGAAIGQALKWSGTTWAPADDSLELPYSGTGTSGSPLFNIVNLGTSGAISTFSSGNYGIWGESGGLSGIGVYGANKLTSGTTYGVFGDVYSSSGFAGFFQGGKVYIQGNTGIGTQNPSAKLEVAGQIKVTGGSPGAGKVLTSDAAGLASWVSPTVTWLKNGSNVYYSPGNVGIGLNNPEGMLEISGNSVDHYPHLFLSETDGYARISFRTMITPAKHWVLAGHTNETDGNSQLHLNYNNGTSGKNLFSVYGDSRITFDGKVGIGKIDPEAPLQVHSNVTYSSGITPVFKISDNFKTWNIGLGASGDRFSIASEDLSERLTILKSNGNVGIGTISPGTKLEVAGQVKITGGSPGSGKVLTSDATGLASWATPSATWLKNGSDIYYNSGYVAIGSTWPRYRLTIYDDKDSWIGFYNSTSGTTGTDGFTIGTSAAGSAVWIWNCEYSNMHFGTNNDNRMIINADGHISMMKSLDLNTESTFGALHVNSAQAVWYNGDYFSWGYGGNWNYFADKIYIGPNAANPGTNYLVVNGDAAKPGGGSWLTWSDARLKNLHGIYSKGLDEIAKLQPVVYSYKDENQLNLPAGINYAGLIAQEVALIFPESVSEGAGGFLQFDMNTVNVAVINAIKELKAENDNLKTENQQLRQNFIQLNARLERLEKLISYSASDNE